jgi:hypothetical protein
MSKAGVSDKARLVPAIYNPEPGDGLMSGVTLSMSTSMDIERVPFDRGAFVKLSLLSAPELPQKSSSERCKAEIGELGGAIHQLRRSGMSSGRPVEVEANARLQGVIQHRPPPQRSAWVSADPASAFNESTTPPMSAPALNQTRTGNLDRLG